MEDKEIESAVEWARAYWRELKDHGTLLGEVEKQAPEVDTAEVLETAARERNPDANDFDALVVAAASILRDPSAPVPVWLRHFVADVLEGKRKRPKKRGPDPYKNYARDMRLYLVTEGVAKHYNIGLYSSIPKSPRSAIDIVERATRREGDHISIDVIRHACKQFGRHHQN